MQNWRNAVSEIIPQVTEWRRLLHKHPEVSGDERWTKGFVTERLQQMGIEVYFFSDCHAVMGVLRNGEGPCVAVRADMDALPVAENTGLPFASECSGVMHACGHDTHMAMALGSALWFSTHRSQWSGTVKWLFEPEEETVGGGQRMVAQGCMENPTVRCVIGQHVNPKYPVGTFLSRSGAVSGSSDELYLTVRGKGCHGAYPQEGVDAIVITAQIVSALQSLVSRTISPFDSAVITFGSISGGKKNNIIADEVKLTGTLRTLNDRTRQALRSRLKNICEGIAASMNGTAELEIRPSYGAVINDPDYYALVSQAAGEICDDIVSVQYPSLGVESFCYFEDHTPGVYYDLGSGISTALHSSTMIVDESVLEIGIALQCASITKLLEAK